MSAWLAYATRNFVESVGWDAGDSEGSVVVSYARRDACCVYVVEVAMWGIVVE